MSSQAPTDTYVHRIQALLDKAESTDFPEEADALLAKAQQLMSRHAIDAAMLEAAGVGRSTDEIDTDDIVVQAPYASAKATLLSVVARANRCRVVMGKGPSGTRYCSVVGYRSDLANVSTLYLALSFQAVRFMLAADVPAHDTARRFRHSFLIAYAVRISERLQEAEQSAVAEAEQEQLRHAGGPSVALTLASRQAKVDAAFAEAHPNLRSTKISASSAAGYGSGRSAADRGRTASPRTLGSQRGLPQG